MSAYQRFLDFFSMHNKERLDGLSDFYFSEMTPEEKGMAFSYLLQMVEGGGTEESVNGLFMADAHRAIPIVEELLKSNRLREDAEVAAAWNLYRLKGDAALLAIFIRLMSSANKRIRAKVAYYVPANLLTTELLVALRGMIRTETDNMALINAVNKLLECYGITRASVTKDEFSELYRGLRNEDGKIKEATFRKLEMRAS